METSPFITGHWLVPDSRHSFLGTSKQQHDLNGKCVLLPRKAHLWWRSVACLSFSLMGSRRKHLSPLPSAQIRCLFIQSEEINPEWSTVGQGRRVRVKGGIQQDFIFDYSVSVWADGICWKNHLCSGRRLELRSNHPPPPHPPIHSNYRYVYLMLSNRNNLRETGDM